MLIIESRSSRGGIPERAVRPSQVLSDPIPADAWIANDGTATLHVDAWIPQGLRQERTGVGCVPCRSLAATDDVGAPQLGSELAAGAQNLFDAGP